MRPDPELLIVNNCHGHKSLLRACGGRLRELGTPKCCPEVSPPGPPTPTPPHPGLKAFVPFTTSMWSYFAWLVGPISLHLCPGGFNVKTFQHGDLDVCVGSACVLCEAGVVFAVCMFCVCCVSVWFCVCGMLCDFSVCVV